MGTNSSKSKSPRSPVAVSPREAVESASGEKGQVVQRLFQNTRLLALENIVAEKLEAYLTQANITEISLQRLGMREVPEQGILLKPLKLELMTTLALDYNQLREIPDFLALQPNISTVTLAGNRFTHTPSLGNTVTWLDLSWNEVTVVDENVSSLIHLRHLDLRHNRLGPRSLPDLSDLNQLEYLDVSENQLSTWPRIATAKLKTLKVGYNVELGDCPDPPSFGPFLLLEHFSCIQTRVKIFPKFLMDCSGLESLEMSSTLIARLPQKLPFQSLNRIDLSATKFVPSSDTSAEMHDIKWKPPSSNSDEVEASLRGLASLGSVEKVRLSGIGLFHIPTSVFSNIPTITHLYLRWNNIYVLPDALFDSHPEVLVCLDLLGNKLESIPVKIEKLKNLRHLSIGHNRLTQLPKEITHLKLLETLVIEDNVWEDPELERLYWETDSVDAIFDRILHPHKPLKPILVDVPDLEGSEEDQLKDRVMGLIFGKALGDSVGLGSEFLMHTQATFTVDTDQIDPLSNYRDRHRIRWLQGDWTDDTDQAILLLEELVQRPLKDGRLNTHTFAKALLQWAEDGFPELGDDGGMGIGATVAKVLRHPSFLTHPQLASTGVWLNGGCTLAANGALMRCAPIALFGFSSMGAPPDEYTGDTQKEDSPEVVQDGETASIKKVPKIGDEVSSLGKDCALVRMNTLDACLVTHADPRCIASCLALNMAICAILRGERRLDEILEIAYLEGLQAFKVPPSAGVTHVEEYPAWSKELDSLIKTQHLGQLDLSDPSKMGYTYKCLGSAFSVFRTSNNFERAIIKITQLAGDADTNGAVAGALLGAKLGYRALPKYWLEALPHRQWLEIRANAAWDTIRARLFPSSSPSSTTSLHGNSNDDKEASRDEN